MALMLGLSVPSTSPAALSVGAQLGANFVGSLDLQGRTWTTRSPIIPNNTVDPSFFTGLMVEYQFINKGVLRYNWPSWMKNFSVALDFSFNPIQFGNQTQRFITNDPNWGTVPLPSFKGYDLTLSCLFKYRFPLLREADFPDGRLFFYVGVGPGVTFSYLEANNTSPGNPAAVGHGNATSPTFVGETGLSLFVVKDVSMDLFFRYRYFVPTYEFNIGVAGPPLYLKFDNSSYTGGVRFAFHF